MKNWNIPPWVFLAGAILYVFSPIDFVPDIPVIGWWDDAIVAVLGVKKWHREREATGGAGAAVQLNPSEPVMAMLVDDRRQDKSLGLFGRAVKAASFVWKGGAL